MSCWRRPWGPSVTMIGSRPSSGTPWRCQNPFPERSFTLSGRVRRASGSEWSVTPAKVARRRCAGCGPRPRTDRRRADRELMEEDPIDDPVMPPWKCLHPSGGSRTIEHMFEYEGERRPDAVDDGLDGVPTEGGYALADAAPDPLSLLREGAAALATCDWEQLDHRTLLGQISALRTVSRTVDAALAVTMATADRSATTEHLCGLSAPSWWAHARLGSGGQGAWLVRARRADRLLRAPRRRSGARRADAGPPPLPRRGGRSRRAARSCSPTTRSCAAKPCGHPSPDGDDS